MRLRAVPDCGGIVRQSGKTAALLRGKNTFLRRCVMLPAWARIQGRIFPQLHQKY
jgi:hypothetical protein